MAWADEARVFEAGGDAATMQGMLIGWSVAVWSCFMALAADSVWLFAGLGIGIALGLVSRAMERRSRPAALIYARTEGLRRYLREFGRMDEKPPGSLSFWLDTV